MVDLVLGTVFVDNEKKRLVASDYEWALKSVLGEVSDNPSRSWEWGAVLYTMLHRWIGPYGRNGESFGGYIKRFSQPVNVRQIGRVHDYDRTESDPSGFVRSRERDARIRALLARPVADIERNSPALAAYVQKFMRGEISRYPYRRMADFAASYAGRQSGDVLLNTGNTKNRFYYESWLGEMDVRFGTRPVVIPVVTGFLLVMGSWFLWNRYGKKYLRL